jgi:uncharacterized protein (DUF2062 family)
MDAATDNAAATTADAPRPGFWQRTLVEPIVRQLTQGVTPRRITFTLATGTVCSLFPFLGFTTLLNLGTGVALRLNQAILQVLNQVLGPLQLVMILVYVRTGEWIWGTGEHRFAITEMIASFSELSLWEFLQKFGWAGIHAFTAWALTAPLLFALVYFPLRPVIDRLAQLPGRPTAPAAS